jgi:hypothetical protein
MDSFPNQAVADGHPDDTVWEVELSMREMRAISKSLGITRDVLGRKMEGCTPGGHRHREMAQEWLATNSALTVVSQVLSEIIEDAA